MLISLASKPYFSKSRASSAIHNGERIPEVVA